MSRRKRRQKQEARRRPFEDLDVWLGALFLLAAFAFSITQALK